jgi:hypothetical protein
VSGSYVYTVCDDLLVFDVSDPVHPAVADPGNTGCGKRDVAVSGGYTYLAGGRLWILRYDEQTLSIDYPTGQPGSFFTLQGARFPADLPAEVTANGRLLGTLQTGPEGDLSFLLSTGGAGAGYYNLTVTAAESSATVQFLLDPDEDLHQQEGSGTIFDLPAGIAYTDLVYLPLVSR